MKLLVLIALALATYFAYKYAREGKRKTVWQAFAARRKWKFRPDDDMTVSGKVGDLNVLVDIIWLNRGTRHTRPEAFTRVSVSGRHPVEVHIGIHTANLVSGLATLLGQQDIKVGDESFDAKYVVSASNEPGALEVLRPEVREAMLSAPRLQLEYDRGTVKIWWKGKEVEQATLDQLTDLAVLVASAPQSERDEVEIA